MKIQNALNRYLADLKGCSESTRETYYNRLIKQPSSFLNFCVKKDIDNMKAIDYPFLEKYRSFVKKTHSDFSLKGMVTAVRGFLRYAYKMEWTAINGSKFRTPVVAPKEKVILSSNIIEKALSNPVGLNPFCIARNNFIMAAFGYLGLEPSGLQRVKISDIKPFEDTGRIESYSRGGIKKSTIIDPITWTVFLEYIKERSSFLSLKRFRDPGILLINNRGVGITASGIESVVRRLKNDLIKKGIVHSDIEFNSSSFRQNARMERSDGAFSNKQLFYIEKRLEHILDNSIVIQTEPCGIRSNMDKVRKLIEQYKKVDPHIKFWWAVFPTIVDDPVSSKIQPLFYDKEGDQINEEPITLYGFKDQILNVTNTIIPKKKSIIKKMEKKTKICDTMRERARMVRLNREE